MKVHDGDRNAKISSPGAALTNREPRDYASRNISEHLDDVSRKQYDVSCGMEEIPFLQGSRDIPPKTPIKSPLFGTMRHTISLLLRGQTTHRLICNGCRWEPGKGFTCNNGAMTET